MKQAGDIVGRFELRGLVGEGGLAQVYLARHRTLGTDHAIKFLSAPTRQMTLRLLQEGRIQARLRHPNIVSVTDVVETEHEVGLVMEFVQGFSLEECIRDGGAMDLDEAMVLFSQILGAVGTAHEAGILHRDLKPANVLLTASGDAVIAKVSDFGIAKFGSTQGTGKGPMGTPGYMAPEQIKDASKVTRRADVFALGALLYEMLSGKPAFPDTDLRGVLNATAEGAFTPLSVHNPNIPRRVVEAVERALDPRPQRRFDSIHAFATALGVPVLINQPPEPVNLAPPGAAPPVRHTIAPEVEMAPEEDEDETEEDPDPLESLRALRKPLPAPRLDPEPGLHEPPRRATLTQKRSEPEKPSPAPRKKKRSFPKGPLPRGPERHASQSRSPRTPPPKPEQERERLADARDSLTPAARFGLDDPKIQTIDSEPKRVTDVPSAPERVDDPASEISESSPEKELHESADGFVADFLIPLARVLGNTARYLLVPVLLLIGVASVSGIKGSEDVKAARDEYLLADEQMDRALKDQAELVAELQSMGATSPSLQTLVDEAQTAEDPVKASRKLSSAMLDQMRVLPATGSPAEEQRRRQLELKVRELDRAHTRHEEALAEWEAASGSFFGTMAVRLGLASPPPASGD